MHVEVTSNFPTFMAAFRRANETRKVQIKSVLSKHGSDYIRTLVKEQLSGRGGALAGLTEAALTGLSRGKRNRAIAAARAALGANALGLNRVTGFGARSWYRVVVQRGNETELTTFTTAGYLRFHADDYVPESGVRRFPVRLQAGALWRSRSSEDALVATLDAIMLRGKAP